MTVFSFFVKWSIVTFSISHVHGHGSRFKCGAHDLSKTLMHEDLEYEQKYHQEMQHAHQASEKYHQLHKHPLALENSMQWHKDHANKSSQSTPLHNQENLLTRKNWQDVYFDQTAANVQQNPTLAPTIKPTSRENAPIYTVFVIFHVLYRDDDQNLSEQQLDSQIVSLNRDFRGQNEELQRRNNPGYVFYDRIADTRIQFAKHKTIRKKVPSNENKWKCHSRHQEFIKLAEHGGSNSIQPNKFLNIWICDIQDSPSGFAYYPGLLGTQHEWLDGIVLKTGFVGDYRHWNRNFNLQSVNHYGLGRTAVHEAGHYFGLPHVWGEEYGCRVELSTDNILDTPLQDDQNWRCPGGGRRKQSNSCHQIDALQHKDLRDMHENFMDYTFDTCKWMFTEEQSIRMRSFLDPGGHRRGLIALTEGWTPAPTSEFNIETIPFWVMMGVDGVLFFMLTGFGFFTTLAILYKTVKRINKWRRIRKVRTRLCMLSRTRQLKQSDLTAADISIDELMHMGFNVQLVAPKPNPPTIFVQPYVPTRAPAPISSNVVVPAPVPMVHPQKVAFHHNGKREEQQILPNQPAIQ